METEQTVFNIIWLDDEIDLLYKEHKEKLLSDGIKVLGKGAQNVEAFELQIQKFRNVVDAVVTDANFNLKERNDFNGLIEVFGLIGKYNHERSIPFIVFTGRDNLRNTVPEKILSKFDAIVSKREERGIEALINKVKEIIQKVNSREFRIHNKYKKELEAASLISGNEAALMDALLYEDSGDWRNTEIYFNSMRSVVESIFSACKRERIIPDVGELNQISNFLDKNNHEAYVFTEEIMPKSLAQGLWYFLNITQDASHKKDNLRLKVVEYVQETGNINLFRSILYIAMDLCLWYAKCKEELNALDYKRKWERRGISISSERTQVKKLIQDYEYVGIVRQHKSTGRYYSGKYLLANPKAGRYQEGDTIIVIESKENDYKFWSEEGWEVDRFVHLSHIRKVEK